VTGSPVIGRRRGAFSTLLRQSGLRASTGGVLATESERKILASTCLYSLYAWLHLWMHVWVAGKTLCDPSLTGAVPERFRDELLSIKRCANVLLTLLFTLLSR